MSPDALSVREVTRKADLKAFIQLPYDLHRGEAHFVPPLRVAENEKFDRQKNPFFEHAEMALFIAEEAGKVVGRVAAIDDDNHNRTHGDNLAFFGFFEAQHQHAAEKLMAAAEAWALARGRRCLRGPANPSMNDGSGFQINAFDTDPFLMMPANGPAYPQYMDALGYQKAKDLYAWLFDHEKADAARLQRLAARAKARTGAVVRSVDMRQFDRELATVKKLYNGAWEDNWGFVKYTEAEFDALAKELKMIVNPEVALFVEIKGEVVGLALTLPDANQVFKKLPEGRLLPFGWWHLVNRKKIIKQARLPILGVVKAHRGKGLELVLIAETIERSLKNGYLRGECSWILEDNDGINKGIAAAGATLYKTYRLYQKELVAR